MDNFTFLKEKYPQLYSGALKAEQMILVDYRSAGNSIRILCETVLRIVTQKYELEDFIRCRCNKIYASNLVLADYLKVYCNKSLLEYASSLKPELRNNLKLLKFKPLRAYRVPPGFPVDLSKVSLKLSDEKGSYYLRMYGNDCSHEYNETTTFVVSYKATVRQMELFHYMAQFYLREDDVTDPYDENLIPAGGSEICSYEVPEDAERTGCIMEYTAFRKGPVRNPYVIIRKYEVKPELYFWQKRCMEAFLAADGPANGTPEGMASLNVIADGEDRLFPYYIIAYEFERKPQKLTTELLGRITYEERLRICQKLACNMYNLHRSSRPIYHRMLTSDCIRLCDFTSSPKGWVPSIINYEFAKIYRPADEPGGTVFPQLQEAEANMPPEYVKYQAPEFSDLIEGNSWAEIDIYALGILFEDVICGEISSRRPDLGNLKLDRRLTDLLNDMTEKNPEQRPDIQEVIERLEKINNKDDKKNGSSRGSGQGSLISRLFIKFFGNQQEFMMERR